MKVLSSENQSENAIEAFEWLQGNQVDLMFLDIEMPDLNGIDFLKGLSRRPEVILTTAYREYALEGYELNVVDYLLKPISFDRFFKAISKLKQFALERSIPQGESSSNKLRNSFYVYSDKRNVKVYFDEIEYVESIKDYVRIHTTKGNIISKDTISRYESLLPDHFLRIHRSYIVNIDSLTAFTQHDVEIGQKELPIGVSYRKKVSQLLKGV